MNPQLNGWNQDNNSGLMGRRSLQRNRLANLLWGLSCRAEREEEERHARALQAQIERAAELGDEAEEAVNNVSVLERQVG